MENEEYLDIKEGLSVGTMKIANKYEIFTEEEIDAINNKIPELDERVGVIEDEIDEINSSLDKKASQSDLLTERRRIDSFVSLNEGSTTGDAELIDARIGADGVTYNNLGTAIRTEISKISNTLNNPKEYLYNNGIANVDFDTAYSYSTSKNILENTGEFYRITYEHSGEAAAQAGIVTKDIIDLTNVSCIYVDWSQLCSHESARSIVSLSQTKTSPSQSATNVRIDYVYEDFNRRITRFDVSDLIGGYYLKIHTAVTGKQFKSEVNVYSIYLEYSSIEKLNNKIDSLNNKIDSLNSELSKNHSMKYASYKDGIENTKFTGGFVTGYIQANTTSEVERLDNYISIKTQATESIADTAIVTDIKIDVTNIESIEVDWENPTYSASTRSNICLTTSKKENRLSGSLCQKDNGFERTVSKIDVSNKNGEYYLSIHGGANSLKSNGQLNIYGIYFNYFNEPILETFIDIDSTIKNILGSDNIPAYWGEEINNVINKVTDYQRLGGYNCTSFGFITDIHWGNNNGNSPALLKKVLNECNVPYYFDGGDVVRGSGLEKKDKLISLIVEEREAFKDVQDKCLRVIGNHDPAYSELGGTSYYAQNLTHEETYDVFFRASAFGNNIVWGGENKYFYADDKAHKIRYIGLDSTDTPYDVNKMRLFCFREAQIKWLANEALNVPSDDWSVVICSHFAPTSTSSSIVNADIILGLLKAFKNKSSYSVVGTNSTYPVSLNVDYTNKGGNVICWIYGHVHSDNIYEVETIKVISTDGDVKEEDKIKGTITEQAFDIFTINKSTRKVNITRVGQGEDREFEY